MNKIMRMHSVTSTIENGFVYLPGKAEWLGEYLHEMTSFPKGKFDDQCDSTSQALDWIKRGYCHYGFVKWLELEAGKFKAGSLDDHPSEACPSCHSKLSSRIGAQKPMRQTVGAAGGTLSGPTRADILFGR
jgi:hypothetical protein